MTALRLARAATGREQILKFAGAYHGHLDGLLAEAGSGLATQALPSSPGVPAAATAATVIVPWNDPEALLAATAGARGQQLAAIIAEPIPANMGLVPAPEGFLELLRDARRRLRRPAHPRRGHLRLPRGPRRRPGAHRRHRRPRRHGQDPRRRAPRRRRRRPRRAARSSSPPPGDVYQAGTLSGNPLAVAAGLATLTLLDESAYLRLAAITEQSRRRPAPGRRDAERAVQVVGAPRAPHRLLLRTARPRPRRCPGCDLDAYAAWSRGLLARGVYPPPSQFEAWFPSLAHSPEQLELTVEAAAAAFAELT